MRVPLRLLIVEDSEDDSLLLVQELKHNGYDPTYTRVETQESMSLALQTHEWDLVTSDYTMPHFTATAALECLKSKSIDVPFIIVSGTIGEARAVSALKAGAHDFIMKGSMSRLVPAIQRELREAAGRKKRKEAEESLLRYAQEVADLYDHAPCGYHSLNPDGVFIRINQTELDWLGYSATDLLHKKKLVDMLTPASAKEFPKAFQTLIETGSVGNLEFEMLRKDGTIIPVILNASAVMDSKGKFVMSRAVVIDNTEHKRLEEQLRQSQKMEAVGQLAGGVAHDFNNLLTVIIGHSLLALERLQPSKPLRNTLEQIHKTGERASALTRQLLAFSRRQILEPKILDLNTVLVDMETMLRRLVPENVRIHLALSPALSRVKVDAGQIEQVLMNLVINARDAISQQGAITLSTADVEIDEIYTGTQAFRPGRFVVLSVSDTGSGMSASVQARIFEPFFTTKELGKGTGLGLSTVYGIVKQSGGQIEVSSAVGKGTTFKVYLPRVEGELHKKESPQPLSATPKNKEVILLVEDNDEVRAVIHEMLRICGFSVLASSSGGEALKLCESHHGDIDLLITDMVMPRMTGPELAERIKQARPRIKMIFMSGYTEHAIETSGVLEQNMHFIQKPFTPGAVARKIREVLES